MKSVNKTHLIRHTISMPFIICSFLYGSVVHSEGEVTPYFSITTLSDNNLYRLDDKVDENSLAAGVSKSDSIYQTKVGVDLDWKISRQQFLVSGALTDSRYDKNSQLDNLGQKLNAKWNWVVGSRFQGVASYQKDISLTSFSDTVDFQKSELTVDSLSFSGFWNYHPSWRVGSGIVKRDSTYDTEARAIYNRETLTTNFDWDFLAETGSRIGLRLQTENTILPNRIVTEDSLIDNEYQQDSILITSFWNFSQKSRINANFGLVSRNHQSIQERDYDGINANFKYSWSPAARFLLSLEGFRRINSTDDILASYSENTGFKVNSVWSYSEKIRLNAGFDNELRDYSGQTGLIESLSSTLKDNYSNMSLGLIYKPHRTFNFGLGYNKSLRDSNGILRDYTSDSVSLNFTLKL